MKSVISHLLNNRSLLEFLTINDDFNDSDRAKYRLLTAVSGVLTATTAISSILNYKNGASTMLTTTLILSAGFLLVCVLLWFHMSLKYITVPVCLVVNVIFTYYIVSGGNQGFAIYWTLIVPVAVGLFFGLVPCIIMGGYFMTFVTIFFYTPLHTLSAFQYTPSTIQRFPVLFLCFFSVALVIQFQLKSLKVRQMNHTRELQQSVNDERSRVENLSLEIIATIMKTLDAKDGYTAQHSSNVARYAAALARKLSWSKEREERLYTLALLHDLGKIGTPEVILNKRGDLDEDEFNIIKKHTIVGGEILRNFTSMPHLYLGALYHHERYDGTGYPYGLKGDEIPVEALILSIADAVDAMNSYRIYRPALSTDEIVQQLKEGRGLQFHPEYADIMLQLIHEGLLESRHSA